MDPIRVRLILEILGRPAQHVTDTLALIVDRMAQEKGVTITHKKLHDPILAQGSKDLFTTFAEVEATFESFNTYFAIVFAYMPSNIEVLSPQNLKITNDEFSQVGNALISRLHMYESVTKKLVADREALINKLKSMGVQIGTAPAEAPRTSAQPAHPQKKRSKKTKAPKKKR